MDADTEVDEPKYKTWGQVYKEQFGYSKTIGTNMKKAGNVSLQEYKEIRKARKKKQREAKHAKHKKALQGRVAKAPSKKK